MVVITDKLCDTQVRIHFIFKIESCATTSSMHDLMEILISTHTKLGQ